MKLLIESTQRPALFTGPDGNRYVIGGTIFSVDGVPVTSGIIRLHKPISIDDIEWKRPMKVKKLPVSIPTVVMVKGSKGALYKVTMLGKKAVSCTCPGFSYRRHCKHIDLK